MSEWVEGRRSRKLREPQAWSKGRSPVATTGDIVECKASASGPPPGARPFPFSFTRRSTVCAYGGEEAWRVWQVSAATQALPRHVSNLPPHAPHDLRRLQTFPACRVYYCTYASAARMIARSSIVSASSATPSTGEAALEPVGQAVGAGSPDEGGECVDSSVGPPEGRQASSNGLPDGGH